jgi:hypothetical protein
MLIDGERIIRPFSSLALKTGSRAISRHETETAEVEVRVQPYGRISLNVSLLPKPFFIKFSNCRRFKFRSWDSFRLAFSLT